MLILTRRFGETLMIGDEVTVTVLGAKGNQVRVGINAPRNLAVHREEVFNRIKAEPGHGHKHPSKKPPEEGADSPSPRGSARGLGPPRP